MEGAAILQTLFIVGLLLEACFFALLRLGDLAERAPEAIALQLGASSLYLASVYLITKAETFPRAVPILLLFSILFRVTFAAATPTLSDDVYRYRWEGQVQADGGNPYEIRPNDPEWAHLRDAAFPKVVGRDFKAGYGPLIELIQRGLYRAVAAVETNPFRQAVWFKLPAIIFDLGILAALLGLFRSLGLESKRIVIYSWSPLPVVEFWGTGHNDALPVLCVVLAFWAAKRERWTWSLLALSAGTAAKLWPALLLPVLLAEMWRRRVRLRWQWLPGAALVTLLCLPYRTNIVENARFMSGFVGGWRNNDSLFGLVLAVTGDPYRAKYLTFLLLGLCLAGAMRARWKLENRFLFVLTATLLLSANCHPWYATWFLPLLTLEPFVPWLLWSALMPLAYTALIDWRTLGIWNGVSSWRWAIHGPFLAMLAANLFRHWRRNQGAAQAETVQ